MHLPYPFHTHTQQQYRELRRRVARPFSRIKILIQKRSSLKPPFEQKAAQVSLQPCRSSKAGVATTFIQLPGEGFNGRPAPGRTGLCLGTALVKVSSSRMSKTRRGRWKSRNGGSAGGGDDDHVMSSRLQGASEGESSNGTLRERRTEREEVHNVDTTM